MRTGARVGTAPGDPEAWEAAERAIGDNSNSSSVVDRAPIVEIRIFAHIATQAIRRSGALRNAHRSAGALVRGCDRLDTKRIGVEAWALEVGRLGGLKGP